MTREEKEKETALFCTVNLYYTLFRNAPKLESLRFVVVVVELHHKSANQ